MSADQAADGRDVRVYVAFPSSGLFSSTDTYPLHHPDQKVLTNDEMLDAIRARCEGIEFTGTTAVESPAATVENIERDKANLDGVLYFGNPPRDLLAMDLPVVAVHPLWGQWQYPFDAYAGHRVVTACLPLIPDASEATFAARLDGIADRLRLLRAVARMRGLRILIVTDKPVLGQYEPTGLQLEAEGWEGYERHYLANLKELGAEVVVRPQSELVTRMKSVSEADAQAVTDEWIGNAAGVRGTNEAQIRDSARLYLVMKEMLAEYGADAITTEGYGVFMNYADGVIPSNELP
ncbi:MAG: hypothetical protein J7M38_11665 [Armatimonadetes bacterium]|nr:hypothetical protein [Armatimonadota bacterium]